MGATEAQRGQHKWPTGDVARRRVRVGGADKPETVVKKMKAFAELVRMFYNASLANQLEVLADDSGTLAAVRVNQVRKYPLVLLISCYESLMFSYVLGVRLQINQLINHLEHMGKFVRKQHIQGNLRLAMAGRGADREMAFSFPAFFRHGKWLTRRGRCFTFGTFLSPSWRTSGVGLS